MTWCHMNGPQSCGRGDDREWSKGRVFFVRVERGKKEGGV